MTSAAEFLRTSRRFVGGDAHIAPRGIIEFALDFRKIGLYRRVDVGIDPYARTVKSGIIRKKAAAFSKRMLPQKRKLIERHGAGRGNV